MPTKGTAKYNWIDIKQKYLESPIEEVKEFLVSFLSVDPKNASNGSFAKATKGWRKEKEEYRKKIALVSEQKTINNPDVQERVKRLIKYTEMIEDSVSYIINFKRKKIIINEKEVIVLDRDLKDMKDIKTAYEILRLATGKSTANVGGDKDNPVQFEELLSFFKKPENS